MERGGEGERGSEAKSKERSFKAKGDNRRYAGCVCGRSEQEERGYGGGLDPVGQEDLRFSALFPQCLKTSPPETLPALTTHSESASPDLIVLRHK